MKGSRLVEVVSFDVQKSLNNSWDHLCTDRLEPVLGDHYSLIISSSFGDVVLPTILLEDCWLSPVEFQVWRKNKRPQFVLWSLTLRASIVLDTHKVGILHVICSPRPENWPAMAHCAVGTGPLSTGNDVSSLRKSPHWLQHYPGDITQHLLVYIALDLVIGSRIVLKFGGHQVEGKRNQREVALFVP